MSYPNEAYTQTAQDYLGNQKGQYIGGSEKSVPVETATSVLSETLQRADELVTRVLQLSNRLCGAEPPRATAAQEATTQGDGILPVMKDHGWAMQRRIRAAEEAIDRIDALL